MNLQQELLQEKKEKEELLLRVSSLEEQVKLLIETQSIMAKKILQLENMTRKLC